MELIYLKYNQSFTSQHEINFSTKLKFTEDLFSFIIEEEDVTENLNNFFDDRISNVTAFIGRNGIGKTTNICKPIMASNWLTYDFIVFKSHGKLLVFKNPRIGKSIENKTNYPIEEKVITDLGPNDDVKEPSSKSNIELNKLIRLYYSTSYSESPFSTYSMLDDISTSGLIAKELALKRGVNDENTQIDSFTSFKFKELSNQIDFLASSLGKEFTSKLNMNSKISVIHLPEKIGVKKEHFKDIELFSELEKEIGKNNSGYIEITSLPGAPRIAIVLWSFLYNFPTKIQEEYLFFLKRKQISFYHNEIKLDQEDSNLNVFIGPLLAILNQVIDKIEEHFILKIGDQIIYSNTVFSIPVQIGKEFINIYKKNLKGNVSKFEFKWNISSGEYSYLSLFSRLYCHDYRSRKKHLLLVIDEGDTNFHPEWSRQYVKLLIEWVPKIMYMAIDIQLVITTHSPYVLSDLPSSNVFTLDRVDGKLVVKNPTNLTFGANIHDLLANDFFLENGFIGEFAKEKIQKIINNLQYDKEPLSINKIEKEEIIKIIQIIGEPFLKDKLLEMYNQKFKENSLYEIEIEKLKSKIKKYEILKKNKNDTN